MLAFLRAYYGQLLAIAGVFALAYLAARLVRARAAAAVWLGALALAGVCDAIVVSGPHTDPADSWGRTRRCGSSR